MGAPADKEETQADKEQIVIAVSNLLLGLRAFLQASSPNRKDILAGLIDATYIAERVCTTNLRLTKILNHVFNELALYGSAIQNKNSQSFDLSQLRLSTQTLAYENLNQLDKLKILIRQPQETAPTAHQLLSMFSDNEKNKQSTATNLTMKNLPPTAPLQRPRPGASN